jgi:NOL1/NOP2/sun family putative RNA methylase
MKKTFFPKEFIDKYSKILGDEKEEFFTCIKEKQPKSFWINTNKTKIDSIKKSLNEKGIALEQYPFHTQACKINYSKPGDLDEFLDGKIALQEKAAMLPVIALAPQKKDYVLDACASPGMKTIQLSNFAGKTLAIDVNSERIKFLEFNKNKYSLENVSIKRSDVRNINEPFDKILLDAPCSSEGLVRKKRDALKGWSQSLVERKAKYQKELIEHCYSLLRKNGEMIYATCSFAPEENEDVVNYLLAKTDAVVEKVSLDGIKIRKNALCKNCVRLFPQDNNTQQFFFAKIRKE